MYQGLARNTCNVSEVGSIPTSSTMSYSDKFKVVWLNPMRTATRSCGIIQRELGFEDTSTHSFIVPEDKINYHFIVNIRNPYSRLVSLYKLNRIWEKKEFNKEDFKGWVDFVFDDKLINKNISTVYLDYLINGLPKKPETYVRVESLIDDLKSLWFIQENFNLIEQVFKDQIVKNNYKMEYEVSIMWKEFYNQELADFVYLKTKPQFDMFNYEKDSWKYGTS